MSGMDMRARVTTNASSYQTLLSVKPRRRRRKAASVIATIDKVAAWAWTAAKERVLCPTARDISNSDPTVGSLRCKPQLSAF